MRRVVVLLLTGLMVLGPAGAARAQDEEANGDLVVLTGDAYLAPDQTVNTMVVFNGKAIVDGTVRHALVSFHGPVTISGTVGEDVVLFSGRLTLRAGARVLGDVYADRRVVAPGAVVDGRIRPLRDFPYAVDWRLGYVAAFGVWLAISISVLILGLIVLWLGPRAADAMFHAARTGIGPAIGWGFAAFFGLPILAVAAIMTLVGIPFGIGLLLALAMLYAMGHTASAWMLGRAIVRPPSGRVAAFLAGWVILAAVGLIPFLSGLIWFAATVFGLGALVVAIWRARRPAVEIPAAPVGPPVPQAPTPAGV